MNTHLVEVAPHRWVVRKKAGGKPIGLIEYHEFYTYTPTGERVKAGFWMSRLPENGWKETGWKKAMTEKDAIKALLNPSKVKWSRTHREVE